jgi:hypothetical protein
VALMDQNWQRVLPLVLGGWEVLLASTFVVFVFAFVEQDWAGFFSERWEVRLANWGRNLCLIGAGATVEFLVYYSDLVAITTNYDVFPRRGGHLQIGIPSMPPSEVLLIILLLIVFSGVVGGLKLAFKKDIPGWASTICLFCGGCVLSLPLLTRYVYLQGIL